MKRKSRKTKTSPKQQSLTDTDFNWGCIYEGTKEALIAAGLAKPEYFRFRKGQESKGYWLPLNWEDRYNEACFGPNFGPIPPRWDARVTNTFAKDGKYSVHVEFGISTDLNIRARADEALKVLRALYGLVHAIPPVPLSTQLGQLGVKAKVLDRNA